MLLKFVASSVTPWENIICHEQIIRITRQQLIVLMRLHHLKRRLLDPVAKT